MNSRDTSIAPRNMSKGQPISERRERDEVANDYKMSMPARKVVGSAISSLSASDIYLPEETAAVGTRGE
jgi:hypothetical protein